MERDPRRVVALAREHGDLVTAVAESVRGSPRDGLRAAAVAPEALDDESDPQRLRGVGQRFVAVPRRASSAAQRTAVPKPAAFESGACDAPLHPCGVQ